MAIQLIADSCCDLSEDMKNETGLHSAPLIVRVNGTDYVDDGTVDVLAMLAHMAREKECATSACPSPEAYAALMKDADESFVITLSSHLSGSYQAACMAKDMVLEDCPDKKIHIFDSESAAAGETRIALLLHDLIREGLPFDKIVERAEEFIRTMRTLFVVEDLTNFIKNGRIKKIPGLMATALNLCPLMSDNDHGEVTALKKLRGAQKALAALVEEVAAQTAGRAKKSLTLVMTHVENEARALSLKDALFEKCPALGKIEIVKAGALSAMYGAQNGIIVAF